MDTPPPANGIQVSISIIPEAPQPGAMNNRTVTNSNAHLQSFAIQAEKFLTELDTRHESNENDIKLLDEFIAKNETLKYRAKTIQEKKNPSEKDPNLIDEAHRNEMPTSTSFRENAGALILRLFQFISLFITALHMYQVHCRMKDYQNDKSADAFSSAPYSNPTTFYFSLRKTRVALAAKNQSKEAKKNAVDRLANVIDTHCHYYQYAALSLAAFCLVITTFATLITPHIEKGLGLKEGLSTRSWYYWPVLGLTLLSVLINIFFKAVEKLANYWSPTETKKYIVREFKELIPLLIQEQSNPVFTGRITNIDNAPATTFLHGILGAKQTTLEDHFLCLENSSSSEEAMNQVAESLGKIVEDLLEGK